MSTDPVREDFLDFSIAWRIQQEAGASLEHDARCQARLTKQGLLCNCGAVVREWERRVRNQQTNR